LDRVFLENGLGKFPDISYLTDLRRTRSAKKIPKTVLKTRQNQRNHVYFDFRKIYCGLFSKPLNKGIFSVFGRFIEDYLRNLMCWENSKNRFGISASKLSRDR
jgi:hypothetical protein